MKMSLPNRVKAATLVSLAAVAILPLGCGGGSSEETDSTPTKVVVTWST
jgi:hypothetical protein